MPRRRSRGFALDLSLDPDTRKGIFTVFLFAIAALLLLSLFDLAGMLGVEIDRAISHVFGWDKITLPFFLIAIGYHELAPERLSLKLTNYLGFLLFYVGLNSLVHVGTFAGATPPIEALSTAGGK